MIVVAFAFVAGLLTILAPCTLPVVPLVLGGAAGGGRRRIGGIFVGFGASFLAVTVVFAAALASLGVTTDRLRLGAAVVLGLVGLGLAWPRVARIFDRALVPVQQRAADRVASPGRRWGGVLAGLDVPLQARLTASLPADLTNALFSIEQQPAVQEGLTVLRPSAAAQDDAVPLEDLGPAPELTGITAWINSEPLSLAALRGKV